MAVLMATLMCALGSNAAEAYACYTPSNTTLTFYYDNKRSSRTGTTYDLSFPDWITDGTCENVTKVVFHSSFAKARPTTTCSWFYTMWNLQSITGMKYLNTSAVVDMSYMFSDCSSLTSLDVSHFNTAKVTNMTSMFYGCELLESLDVSSFNTSNVKTMKLMFSYCETLTSLDVSNFNTAKVTDMSFMFRKCELLKSLDLTSFDTSNVTDMSYMFYDCYALTSLDLSRFNTAKVTNMGMMFCDCNNLKTIYVGNGWSTAAVTESEAMFFLCNSLVGGKGTTYDGNHVDKTYAHIDGGTSNPGYFTEKMPDAYACYTESNTTLTFYCDYKLSSRTGKFYSIPDDDYVGWNSDDTYENVTHVVFDSSFANARPTTTSYWFYDMENLESITGMEYLNTSEVTDMTYMFTQCYKLKSLDLSHFNTAKITDMSFMFYSCQALKSLDLSHFNTSKVQYMGAMFADCNNLTSLDVSHFNTSKVTHMTNMFYGCKALTSLDLSSFDTSNVTDMNTMFYECNNLKSLDLSSFNTAKVEDMFMMFYNCSNLKSIFVGKDWSTANLIQSLYMFEGCTSLVGGQGTAYDESHVDATYAHVDEGTSNPGYLTAATVAYACYTPSNTTLTFYYDNQYNSRTGTFYDLDTGDDLPDWFYDGNYTDVTKVVFNSSFAKARPTSTCGWFNQMTNLQSITGLNYLNTSEVTNMGWMFCFCQELTSLDVSHFNTSKVTSMNSMFGACSSLTSLDLSSFNTSKVTDMYQMFGNSSNLQTIYVGSGWSTAAVTSSTSMFSNCTKLKGGKGTAYSSSNPKDATYAHVDGGTSNPGYFTYSAGLVTHIEAVPAKANTVKGIYTLDGRKLNDLPTQKGIYIIDGRRVVIK